MRSSRGGWLMNGVVLVGLTIGLLVLGAVLLPRSENETSPGSGSGAATSAVH